MTTNVNDRDSVVSSHSAITSTSVNPASTYLEERANGFPDPLATPSQPVPGWPQVATLMAASHDYASFNRFTDLQFRSLLYYQAELEILKKDLQKEEWKDYRRGGADAAHYSKRADYLVRPRERDDETASKQWRIVLRLRDVLKQYNEALLQFAQVAALEEPETHNLEKFTEWLGNPVAGNLSIGGRGEQNTWGDIYRGREKMSFRRLLRLFWKMIWSFVWPEKSPPTGLDLAAIYPKNIGGFSGWVKTSFVPFWAGCRRYLKERREQRRMMKIDEESLGRDPTVEERMKTRGETIEEALTVYSQSSVVRFIRFFSTLVACLFPTIAISVLSQLHETRDLLLCLAGFALVFAAGLLFLGAATRVEIFSATAAFSAVLVVFISVPIVIVPPSGVPYVPGS